MANLENDRLLMLFQVTEIVTVWAVANCLEAIKKIVVLHA
jgi:hypothetical protein